jgi:hypothetical protein
MNRRHWLDSGGRRHNYGFDACRACLGDTVTVTNSDVVSTPQAGAAAQDSSRDQGRRGSRLEKIAGITDQMVLQFSRPASQITGRLISLFGLALIAATLVLAIIHMLGAVDFVAATIAGALLAIAGILTLMTDYISAQNAAMIETARVGAEELKRAEAERQANGAALDRPRPASIEGVNESTSP